MKILVLGGYGVFGGRLVRLLADLAQLELLIAGRTLAAAQAFCATHQGQPRVRPLQVDRRQLAPVLQAERPDLVVDASGPFQDYGEHRYSAVEACIAAGIDYLDFADAADFVFGVSAYDAQARAAGVYVLSGVSSFPVLTAAVLRQMATRMDIVRVEGGIAPSPFAGIGLNVMRAVVGYAGSPVKLRRHGRDGHGVGLAESRRFTVAVPGRLPLRNLHFSLVDVPDLQVLPPEHPTMTDIWMGAGPVPEVLHRVLNLLAKARWRFKLPSLEPCSRLFYTVLNLMKFGEHRGGMIVRAQGTSNGAPMEQSWHLLAEADDGPYIPSMAIEAVIRKQLAGERPAPGARAATHALELSDYEQLFVGRTIHTGFRRDMPGASLYQRVLGDAYARLPATVQALHAPGAAQRWVGQAQVERGRGVLSRVLGRIFGFPAAAANVPVTVQFSPEAGGERWTRTFNGQRFSSLQTEGKGRDEALLVERFGAVAVALALVVDGGRLQLVPRSWSVLGIPLPRALLPGDQSFEYEADGRFVFDVEIGAPGVGRIVHYRGTLQPG
ncbi:SDR family oxidoreductase [Stenotrophomonas sp. ZAC14D2_NAIMI4_6]|uniref:SDR family oxidoreductase n=1 Tax=Stenotrophomonas sp. ZAC14D2_NAIMI4_6 TaxID=2072406 RepID=UPI000D541F2E|nr:SDR family oxidoreductase [Stenotrophomonas sp. ZAC14D2_NAIMI4_6]AWH22221.1 saccharopine dehydrogenase [Stenotrophomonas sp. ZAC14D2_NAIMI4_6]